MRGPAIFRLVVVRLGGALFSLLALLIFGALLVGSLLPPGPQLVYMSDDAADWDVVRLDVRRGVNVRLTGPGGNDRYPAWSPDGTRIIYHSDRSGEYDLYVMNADGSNDQRIAATSRDPTTLEAMAAWSPDGAYVSFHVYYINLAADLYLLDTASGEVLRVTRDPLDDVRLAWSPDGTRVAFSSERESSFLDLFVMDTADMLAAAQIFTPGLDGLPPGLPPSEVPGTPTPGANDFFLDTLPATQLTRSLGDDWHASWSPDGTHIVYHSDQDLNYELYVVDVAGGTPRNLTQYPFADDWQPQWLPDGRILFASNRAGSFDLYTIRPDGSDLRRLTYGRSGEQAPAWRP